MGFSLGIGLGLARAVGGDAGPLSPTGIDVGTLVAQDLTRADWSHHEYSSDGTTIAAYTDPTDGACAWVNQALNAGGLGRVYARFVAPPGTTSVILTVRCKAGAGTPAPFFYVYQPGVGPVGAPANPTLGATMTDYTITRAVVAGQEYGVLLFFNAAGQCSVIVESVRVEPVGATGLFAGDFYRVPLDHASAALDAFPTRWHDNNASKSNLALVAPGSRWDVLTDATSFALEGGPVAGTYSVASVEVDGVVSASCTFAGYELKTFSLGAGERRVSVVAAPHTTSGALNTGSNIAGTFPRALYVGACRTLELSALALPARRVLVYGDSITAGYNATLGASHWALMRRDDTCAPLLLAAGSAALAFDGNDATARQNFVNSLASLTFDDIWLAIGTNDWGLTSWANVAAFQTAYSDLLDKLITAYPSKDIYAQTPLPRTGTTNGNGETLAQYRSAVAIAAAGRPTVMTVDGTTLCTVGDLPDGTHPDDAGCVVLQGSITSVLDGPFDGGTTDDIIIARSPALYLDFGDTSTLYQDLGTTLVNANGQPIRQVNDKSGNGRNWTAVSSGQSPAYTTGQQNGRSAAVFNGVTSNRYMSGNIAPSGTGMHAFIVYRLDADPPSSLNDVGMWHLSSYVAMAAHHPYTDGTFYDTTGANQRLTVGNPAPSLTTCRIYEVQSSASAYTVRLDGSQIYTLAANVFAWPTTGVIGRNSGGVQYMRGAIMAVVVFPTTLGTSDATAVRNALKTIWGTP